MKNIHANIKQIDKTIKEEYIKQTYMRFLKLKGEQIESEIRSSIAALGLFLNTDRVYIYKFLDDATIMQLSYEWLREGIPSRRDSTQEELAYQYPWLMRKIKNNECVVINNVEDIPDEAYSERDMMTKHCVKACFIVPMTVNKVVQGYVGLDSVCSSMIWQQEAINMVQNLGEIWIAYIERLQQERILRSKLNDSMLILDNSDVQIWFLKNTTVYGAVNNSHARFFGKSKEELEYKDLYEVFSPETANLLCKLYWDMFQQKREAINEIWIEDSRGINRLLQIKSKPKFDLIGNIEYLVCTAQDITEQRKTQEDLFNAKKAAEEANSAKSQFLANMSHEIRTPLNGIIGFIDLLMRTNLNEEQSDYLTQINSASDILLFLVNDILDYSKIEAGKLELEHALFDVHALIKESVKLFSSKVNEKKIKMELLISPEVPEILYGDPGRIRQVLNNLISNAVKFTEVGNIIVRLVVLENNEKYIKLQFQVSDTGIGMSQELLLKLFNVFTQADATTTRKYGGTGLGLAISKRLIMLMGGVISVESVLGKGSTFYVELDLEKYKIQDEFSANNWPKIEKNVIQSPVNLSEPMPLFLSNMNKQVTGITDLTSNQITQNKYYNVLLVEDTVANQKLATAMLKQLGYKVELAENGQQAVFMCKNKKYDIILMDCQMPLLDGYEAAYIIKTNGELNQNTIMIAMTAHAMEGDRAKCIAAGMDDYISKPITMIKLNNIIQKWLSKYLCHQSDT
ncbi:ATP-binding protein [Lacrimispora amygdalina]|nr:ATP-binding protein [Clostridium indicum]